MQEGLDSVIPGPELGEEDHTEFTDQHDIFELMSEGSITDFYYTFEVEEEPPPVVSRLWAAINAGVIPLDTFFVKYIIFVCVYYMYYGRKPSEWDADTMQPDFKKDHPEVVSFCETLYFLGHESTYRYVSGPGGLGQGRGVLHSLSTRNLPLLSVRAIIASRPGYTTKPGIIAPLQQYNYSVCTNPARDVGCVSISKFVKIIPFSLGRDGMGVKQECVLDQTQKEYVGLKSGSGVPTGPNDLTGLEDMVALSKKLISQCGSIQMTTLKNRISLAAGQDLDIAGGSGEEVFKSTIDTIKLTQTCDGCTPVAPCEDMILTDPNFCKSTCSSGKCPALARTWAEKVYGKVHQEMAEQVLSDNWCLSFPPACNECQQLGHETAISQFRRCDRCVTEGRVCCKFCCFSFSLDCESKNATCMKLWLQRALLGVLALDVLLANPVSDMHHLLKRAFQLMQNHILTKDGIFLFHEMFRVFRSDRVLKPIFQKFGVTLDAARGKDMMATNVFLQRTQMCDEIEKRVTQVTNLLVPSVLRLHNGNAIGLNTKYIDVAACNTQSFFFLGENDQTQTRGLYKAILNSPIDVIGIDVNMDVPTAVSVSNGMTNSLQESSLLSSGMVFVAEKSGLRYLDAFAAGTVSINPSLLHGIHLHNALRGYDISEDLIDTLVQTGKQYLLSCKLMEVEPVLLPHMYTLKKLESLSNELPWPDDTKYTLNHVRIPFHTPFHQSDAKNCT